MVSPWLSILFLQFVSEFSHVLVLRLDDTSLLKFFWSMIQDKKGSMTRIRKDPWSRIRKRELKLRIVTAGIFCLCMATSMSTENIILELFSVSPFSSTNPHFTPSLQLDWHHCLPIRREHHVSTDNPRSMRRSLGILWKKPSQEKSCKFCLVGKPHLEPASVAISGWEFFHVGQFPSPLSLSASSPPVLSRIPYSRFHALSLLHSLRLSRSFRGLRGKSLAALTLVSFAWEPAEALPFAAMNNTPS